MTTALTIVEKYRTHIGSPDYYTGKTLLTRQMLTKWAEDPERKFVCIFCDSIWSPNVKICPRCQEYKGFVPAINNWSC